MLKIIWSSTLLFILILILYAFAYFIKGNIYQVWKFAAVMPLTFIPISILIIWALFILKNNKRSQLFRILLGAIVLVVFVFLVNCFVYFFRF